MVAHSIHDCRLVKLSDSVERETIMVFYSWWTKTCLLALCFVLISYLMYLVGLYCIIVEDSARISEVSSHSPFHSSVVDALIVFCVVLFLEKICLTGLLYVQITREKSYFPGISAVWCAFFSILCFVCAGYLSVSYERELFSTFPAIAGNVSFDQTASSIHPKFILAFLGTLLNGLSWLFVIFLGMTKTHSFLTQDTRLPQDKISNLYVSVRMIIFITALYYSVANWNLVVSNIFPDFVHSVYVMYLFFPYLTSLSISECIGDSRLTKGVILSIITIFVSFLLKNLLDLARIIYHCSSDWTQLQCIEQNPVYYSTVISSGIAGILLWMCIGELWPNSSNNSSSPRYDLPGGVLSLEEEYLTKASDSVV